MTRRMAAGGLVMFAVMALGWPGCVFDTASLEGKGDCGSGYKYCGDVGCASLDDPLHGCGDPTCVACTANHARTMICDSREACAIAACNAGWAQCPGTLGCSTNLTADPQHCGNCTTRCPSLPLSNT